MNRIKVSVIIPAYNVEQYIEKCVRSIINQTYSNLEIIVIDDGSTDKTSCLLDQLAVTDARLHVVHTVNSGVSEARNTGIDISTGDYLTFVDGDDYLEEDYIEYMVSILKSHKSDFCISKNSYIKKGDIQIKDKIEDITSDEAIALLLSPRIVVGCWNKFYKRSFLIDNNLRFSNKLKYGEGLHFITRCAAKAGSITTTEHKGYYYRRNNASSATTEFNMDKTLNGLLALKMIRSDVPLNNTKSKSMMLLHQCMYYAGATSRLRNSNEYMDNTIIYKRWLTYNRKHIISIILNEYIPIYRKTLLVFNCISPLVLGKLDIIRRKRIVNNSI